MEVKKGIEGRFKKLREEIDSVEEGLYIELNKKYNQIFIDIISILDQEKKKEIQYFKWESECENGLDALDKTNNVNQKIKLLYN